MHATRVNDNIYDNDNNVVVLITIIRNNKKTNDNHGFVNSNNTR